MIKNINKNIVFNFTGQLWSNLLAFLLTPYYVKLLGFESYGLVGFYATLFAFVNLFDIGISQTVNKEASNFDLSKSKEFIQKFKILELTLFSFSSLIYIIIFFSSNWIASSWLKHSDQIEIEKVIKIIGLITCLRLFEGIYRSVLLGFQEQKKYNFILIFITTLRNFGSLFVLIYLDNTILSFFLWNLLSSLISLFLLMSYSYSFFPKGSFFSKINFKKITYFKNELAILFFLGILKFLISQLDKISLSNLLSLEKFGQYITCSNLSSMVLFIIQPFTIAIFPLFSNKNILSNDIENIFNRYSQYVSVLFSSVTFILYFNTEFILNEYTKNSLMEDDFSNIFSLLVIGNLLNVLQWIPYNLLLARGKINFQLYMNISYVIIFYPILYFIYPIYGIFVFPISWIIFNLIGLIINFFMLYKQQLLINIFKGLLENIFIQLLSILVITLLFFKLQPINLSRVEKYFYISIEFIFTIIIGISLSRNIKVLNRFKNA